MSAAAHPGFGAFAKAHREFFDALAPEGWEPVAGYAGVEQKLLSGGLDHAARSGAMTRLSRWAPGAFVAEPVVHDWCEEVLLISGSLRIGRPGDLDGSELLPAGSYACRPAQVLHGPFFTEGGCLMIEFNYYPPSPSTRQERLP
ncbi:MAG TPA: cupin [Bosea sp. (in: a-proteobacteria)]|uniref:cupin domain-containing protein n=1 Tax=Bosea sp. (in: a-proteobacteria) TaxID=1871050 RepID=UPI002E1395F0|nr:cupin [Bosea sp. (in: a-proteobacteria)]